MKRFMVITWYYDGDSNLIEQRVRFYDSLASARIYVDKTNSDGDYSQLYMWHNSNDSCGYYSYCNE